MVSILNRGIERDMFLHRSPENGSMNVIPVDNRLDRTVLRLERIGPMIFLSHSTLNVFEELEVIEVREAAKKGCSSSNLLGALKGRAARVPVCE